MERTFGHLPSSVLIAAVVAAAASQAFSAPVTGERSGKEVVQEVCFRCHEAPKSGAPQVGDKKAWVPRMSKGIDVLEMSAIRGHGGMPPRGGRADLTDGEIRSAIYYMFNPQAAATAAPVAAPAPPAGGGQSVLVNGVRIYFGFASAEQMRGYPPGSPEAKMHGGIPAGEGYQHVNVTLVDAASKAPIPGATVTLEVEQVGMDSVTKVLEPMTLGGSAGYGAYVRLLPKATYTFHVKVLRPGSAVPVEATFPHPG
ncbi:MAG: c-type cytochrome [Usitatibacter sp.]